MKLFEAEGVQVQQHMQRGHGPQHTVFEQPPRLYDMGRDVQQDLDELTGAGLDVAALEPNGFVGVQDVVQPSGLTVNAHAHANTHMQPQMNTQRHNGTPGDQPMALRDMLYTCYGTVTAHWAHKYTHAHTHITHARHAYNHEPRSACVFDSAA